MVEKFGGKKTMSQKIIDELKEIIDYFKFHNKNLTKQQYYYIIQIENIVDRIKEEDNKQ